MRVALRIRTLNTLRRRLHSSLFLRFSATSSSATKSVNSMLPSTKDVDRDSREHAGMREQLCPTRRDTPNLSHAMEDVTVSHAGRRPSEPLDRDFTSGSLSTGERYKPTDSHSKPHPSASHPSLVDRFEGEAEEVAGRLRHDPQQAEAGRAQKDYGRHAIKEGLRNGGGTVMR